MCYVDRGGNSAGTSGWITLSAGSGRVSLPVQFLLLRGVVSVHYHDSICPVSGLHAKFHSPIVVVSKSSLL